MIRRLIHIDEWLSEYLQDVSESIGIPVNELIRIGCYLNIIEFAKISGYKPGMDARKTYLMVKASPTKATVKKMYDLVVHEGRKAAEFRLAKKVIVARPKTKTLRRDQALMTRRREIRKRAQCQS